MELEFYDDHGEFSGIMFTGTEHPEMIGFEVR
jgi:hypothetical protein